MPGFIRRMRIGEEMEVKTRDGTLIGSVKITATAEKDASVQFVFDEQYNLGPPKPDNHPVLFSHIKLKGYETFLKNQGTSGISVYGVARSGDRVLMEYEEITGTNMRRKKRKKRREIIVNVVHHVTAQYTLASYKEIQNDHRTNDQELDDPQASE